MSMFSGRAADVRKRTASRMEHALEVVADAIDPLVNPPATGEVPAVSAADPSPVPPADE